MEDSLPIEVEEAFTDIGHPLYEWVRNGFAWEPWQVWMDYYMRLEEPRYDIA